MDNEKTYTKNNQKLRWLEKEMNQNTRSTSRAPVQADKKKYLQVKFDDLEVVVMEKNAALYGDAFND